MVLKPQILLVILLLWVTVLKQRLLQGLALVIVLRLPLVQILVLPWVKVQLPINLAILLLANLQVHRINIL